MSKYRNWTDKQLSFLLDNYGKVGVEKISREISKPVGSIYYILNKENIDLEKQWWSRDEVKMLKELYPNHSNQELEQIFSRSEDAIQLKAASLGLKKDKWWSEEDVELLREMVLDGLSCTKMAKTFGRTRAAVYNKLRDEKLTNECRRWTDAELAKIKSMALSRNYTYMDIAMELAATPGQVHMACKHYGWHDQIKRTLSYGNDKMVSILRKLFPNYTIKQEYHVGERLRLDAYINELNIGFEYDGIQHFRYTPQWHRTKAEFQRALDRDKRKEELCRQNRITLIRIKYDEDCTPDLITKKVSSAMMAGAISRSSDKIAQIAMNKPKAKIPHPKKYNWPKGKKIPSRPFPKRKKQ
jgi:hypothetical protein